MSREASFTLTKYALRAVLIGAIAAMIGLGLTVTTTSVGTVAPVLAIATALTGWYLLAQGRRSAAIWVLVCGVWVLMTGVAAYSGGVRAPIVVIYPVLILVTGWLISLPAALALAVASVAATVILFLGESLAFFQPTVFTPLSIYAIDQVVVYALSAALVIFIVRAYQCRVHELRMARDEQVQLTFSLETSEAELQRAQAVAKVGSWIYDVAQDITQLSDETCRIFGLASKTQASYGDYVVRTHPDDRAVVAKRWQAALRSGIFDSQHRIMVGDTERWIQQRGELEFSADGRPLQVVGVTQDITARKLVEVALQESEVLHRLLIENSHDIIYTLDANGVFTFVSHAWTTLLGHPIDQVLGHPFMPFVHPADLPTCVNALQQMFAFGLAQDDIEYRVRHTDGLWRWYRCNASPLRNVDGKVVGFLGSAMDITRHKQIQQQERQLAFYDPLTRLPNRRMLDERLERALLASKRSGRYGALMFLDLDNFKPLNDRHGHVVGDLLLIEVANRLKCCVRETDTVARFGGDEFVVMLHELDMDEAESRLQADAIAEKIHSQLCEPYLLDTTLGTPVAHRCTASIGFTLFIGHTASQHEILKAADAAMYEAKAVGPNLIRFAGRNA